ncbi:uncharacterized protein [Rutidosis leptorrhynchoides]|uniref:uncharacterized protein n=1 Tax=Rutidosis leptorrhynchoides TaxID=125765 RepID=UPI003A9A0A7D
MSLDDLSIIALDHDLSDHCPLLLRDKIIDYGPKPFKVFDEWFNCTGIDNVIIEAWNQPIRGSRKDYNFRDKLKNVKPHLGIGAKKTLSNGCRPMLVDCPDSYGPPNISHVSVHGPEIHTDNIGPITEMARPVGPNAEMSRQVSDNPTINGAGSFPGTDSNTPGQSHKMFRVTDAENESLQAEFSEKEIWDAINECASNKAPGPDGFNMHFYIKKNWAIIREDLIAAINQFWSTGSISSGCNSSFITLVLKRRIL